MAKETDMEKYLNSPRILIVFIGNSWDLDACKCPNQENLLILRSSDGFQLTNKRHSMAYTT
jgi:hypothetical protein